MTMSLIVMTFTDQTPCKDLLGVQEQENASLGHIETHPMQRLQPKGFVDVFGRRNDFTLLDDLVDPS